MIKNKKGFTLVELIITIVIVAALGLAATFGLQKVLKGNKKATYVNDIKDVLDSTKTYLAATRVSDDTTAHYVTLNSVVTSGYVDENIYNKINGLTCTNFDTTTRIYYRTDGGMRRVFLKINLSQGNCNNNNCCFLDDIASCNIQEEC